MTTKEEKEQFDKGWKMGKQEAIWEIIQHLQKTYIEDRKDE